MSAANQKPAYRIESDDQYACPTCTHRRQWMVVGPDDIAESVSWDAEEDAQDMADMLNAAYEKGERAGLRSQGDSQENA